MSTAWVTLFAAIAVEVGATSVLPRTDGFRDPLWSALVVIGWLAAIWMLTLVVQEIPVSVAYAVWAGLGTAVIAVVGVLFLGESLTALKAGAIALIVTGVVVLNLSGAAHR